MVPLGNICLSHYNKTCIQNQENIPEYKVEHNYMIENQFQHLQRRRLSVYAIGKENLSRQTCSQFSSGHHVILKIMFHTSKWNFILSYSYMINLLNIKGHVITPFSATRDKQPSRLTKLPLEC